MKKELEQLLNVDLLNFYYCRNEALLEALQMNFENLTVGSQLRKTLKELFSIINDVYISELARKASPLLWYNIIFLFKKNDDRVETHELEIRLTLIALYLLDYFFKKLNYININLVIRNEIVFYFPSIKKSIYFKKNSSLLVLKKNNLLTLKVKENSENYSTQYIDKNEFSFEIINDLVSDFYGQFIATIDFSCGREKFRNSVNNAMGHICLLDVDLYKDIIELINLYVPLKIPENIHNSNKNNYYSSSFSIQNLIGTIFVSYTDNSFWLAETIVHEYSHNLLNTFMLSYDLVKPSEKIFYSPWKNELRHAHGLLHALFSFSYASAFMSKFLNVKLKKYDDDFIKNRLLIHAHRLNFAFKQDISNYLTERGKMVYSLTKKKFMESKASEFLKIQCPKEVEDHYIQANNST